MNHPELIVKARKVISDILYITIATCDRSGQPWNSPVYSAFDNEYNFYWASWKENQHSKNIADNERVFVVIYDSTVPEGTGSGVYMRGIARQLEVKDLIEIIKSLKLLYSRKSKKTRKPEEFLGFLPRRIYKFIPEQVWINSEGDIKGNFIDARIDITADILKK
ncbi:MAG: pyridoxamine 5'-phosphate oxidase family protein [Candidatus Komeilibacteria bacterium]|nr:pyridoxamine 5'-phosphate oxidase family protein [Candidatus Komeilibacteria bacterium]